MGKSRLYLGVALMAVIASACGSSAPANSSSPTTLSTTPHAKTLTHITMVEAVSAPAYAPVTVAEDAGFFKKNGLSVKVIPLQAGSTAAQALVSGSAQFDAGVASDVLLADSKGASLESIAALTNSINLDIEVSKSFAQSKGLTSSESLRTRLLDLKGAKIGITARGSITDLAVRFMLGSVGLKPVTDYHEVAIGSPATNLAALKGGEIQATIFDPAFSKLASEEGVGVLGAKAIELPTLKDAAFGQVITSVAYAKANPTVVKEVATSFAETNNFILNDPSKAMPYIDKIYSSIKPSILAYAIPQYHFAKNAATTATAWSNVAQVFVQNGELTPSQAKEVETKYTNKYLP